jgi:hypothetical protein
MAALACESLPPLVRWSGLAGTRSRRLARSSPLAIWSGTAAELTQAAPPLLSLSEIAPTIQIQSGKPQTRPKRLSRLGALFVYALVSAAARCYRLAARLFLRPQPAIGNGEREQKAVSSRC